MTPNQRRRTGEKYRRLAYELADDAVRLRRHGQAGDADRAADISRLLGSLGRDMCP